MPIGVFHCYSVWIELKIFCRNFQFKPNKFTIFFVYTVEYKFYFYFLGLTHLKCKIKLNRIQGQIRF